MLVNFEQNGLVAECKVFAVVVTPALREDGHSPMLLFLFDLRSAGYLTFGLAAFGTGTSSRGITRMRSSIFFASIFIGSFFFFDSIFFAIAR